MKFLKITLEKAKTVQKEYFSVRKIKMKSPWVIPSQFNLPHPNPNPNPNLPQFLLSEFIEVNFPKIFLK